MNEDLTQKKFQESLVTSELRYRRLFMSAKDGILILDAETGQIEEVNPCLVELVGYSRDQMVGKRIWEIGFLKDVIANIDHFARLKEKKYIRYDDRPLETFDGRKIPVEFVSNVYREGHHNVIQCNIRDITGKKELEKRRQLSISILTVLNRSELTNDAIREILRLIKKDTGFEAIAIRLRDGGDFPYYEASGFTDFFVEKERTLCAKDATGKVVLDESGNPFLECMCGNVISGRTDKTKPFFTEQGSFWTNSTTKLLASTTEKDLQARTRNQCNSEGYESVALIPLRSNTGIVGLLQIHDHRPDMFTSDSIGFFEEIGSSIGIALFRRKAMTESRKYEEQLQLNQKRESLGILAGGIAHDFNNLMCGIFGNMDMAIEASRDEKVSGYLKEAIATIEKARGLTGQLLTFAKGGAPLRKAGHLFPFVQETAQFLLSGSAVSGRFDVPLDLWPSCFDQNQIGQVIDNIVINAMQAMPGGGMLEISAINLTMGEKQHPALASGNYVKISIRDTGAGIPPEIRSRIFDPFYSTKANGHGLGLATSYSIMAHHGGCIDVESEPGKGSTFHLHLPAADNSVLPKAATPGEKHKGTGTFLVMDDQVMLQDVLREILKSFGYDVVCKENGSDAIVFCEAQKKAERPIAGMILDLTVPGAMGGKEAIGVIRKWYPRTPVFVASGYSDDPVMSNPGNYGFDASIGKPFKIAELSEILNSTGSNHTPD